MWIHPNFRHCNAKGENVRRYPAYRESFARRRCPVPATGYYEWMKVTPKVKQRYYIERQDGRLTRTPKLEIKFRVKSLLP